MFNVDDQDRQPLSLEETLRNLGGEIASTRTTVGGYFGPIYLAILAVIGMCYAIYLSYTYGLVDSPLDKEFRRQLFLLGIIGGPLLLALIYWYWRSLRCTIFLCEGGLVEVTPRAIRSIPWHCVTQLDTVSADRQFLKGPVGKATAIRDSVYVVTYADPTTAQDSAILIERWAFQDAAQFYSTLYAAAESQIESARINSV